MSKVMDGGIVTAYGAAVRGGYTGTYQQFCAALGQLTEVLEEFEGFSVEVTTLSPGAPATANYHDGVLTLGIPRGETGNGIQSAVLNSDYTLTLTWTNGQHTTVGPIRGAVGATPNLTIGNVQTLQPSQPATATITGTPEDPVLNFGIPKGDPGTNGVSPAVTITEITDGHRVTITDGDHPQGQSFDVMDGQDGASDAGDVTYDETATYQSGTVGAELSSQKNAISQLDNVVNDPVHGLAQKAPLIVNNASGNIASFADGADDMPIKKLVASIEPVQDLHGYDNPWPAGGGKNIAYLSADNIYSEQQNTHSFANNGVVVTSSGNYGRVGFSVPVVTGETYTVSAKCKRGNLSIVRVGLSDETGWNNTYGVLTSSSEITETLALFTKTITATSDILCIEVYAGQNGAVITFEDFQVEKSPSYTSFAPYANICPITGWTGLTGKRTGENILDNTGIEVTANNLRIARNTGYGDPFLLKGGVTYTFYSNSPTRPDAIYLLVPYTSEAVYYNQGSAFFTVTPTEDAEFGINFYWINGRPSEATALYCVVGDAIGSYDPYQGQTISVSWATEAGTVYGGTLDVVTGELRVTHVIAEFDGSSDEQWGKGDYENYRIPIAGMPVVPVNTNGILACNRLKPIAFNDRGSTTVPCIMCEGSEASIELRRLTTLNITTVAELRTWLSNNPVSAVYPLATPQTYQLDPVTVNTLLGNNTVYVDCGSVTVDYPADTGIVVAEQSNAIDQKQDATSYVTLSGTIVTQTGADNTMYLCGELAELTFTAPATGQTAIRFTSGTTPTVATFSGVTWLNGFDPTAIEASKMYEINILNGLGCAAWT